MTNFLKISNCLGTKYWKQFHYHKNLICQSKEFGVGSKVILIWF